MSLGSNEYSCMSFLATLRMIDIVTSYQNSPISYFFQSVMTNLELAELQVKIFNIQGLAFYAVPRGG